MKIIFIGGTFDPPHLGHRAIAEKLLNKCEKLIFFPAKKSPHKFHNPIAKISDRIKMLELLCSNLSNVEIDRYELINDAPSYTINTIKYLKI